MTDHKHQFRMLNIIVFLTNKSFAQTTKQPLNNFEPQEP